NSTAPYTMFLLGAEYSSAVSYPVTGTLSTSVTSSPPTVTAGKQVQYTVTVSNTTAANVAAVQTVDTLPAGTTFVSASGGCTGTGPVTCVLGTINSGSSASASILVTTASGSGGTTIFDSATTSPGGSHASVSTQVKAPAPGNASSYVPPGGSLSSGGSSPG